MREALEMYTIYEKPKDYPEGFIIRRWLVLPGGKLEPAPEIYFYRGKSLEDCRAEMVKRGLYNLKREPGDDPCVVETWI